MTAKVSWSNEASQVPEWQRKIAVAAANFISDQGQDLIFENAVLVESIACDAEVLRVNMAVRTIPALKTVKIGIKL